MAIVLDQASIGEAAIDSAATTIPFTTTGSAVPANGFIVVTCTWIGSGISLSSVSGGSLTWTVDAFGVEFSDEHVAVASAQAPSGLASGTIITGNFSGAGATAGRSICGTSFTGVLSSSPIDVVGTIQLTNGVTAWTSGNLTVAAGSMTIAVSGGFTSNFTSTVTGPSVEDHDVNGGAGSFDATTCHRIDSGGGSVSVAGAWSSAQNGGTIAVAYLAAPAVAVSGARTSVHLPFINN